MRYRREPRWNEGRSFFKNSAPKKVQDWLTDRGSLTQRLICACNKKNQGNFRVVVLKQAWQKPQASEAKLLGMKQNELGFIRQVHLYCGNIPWVYAKTVIPRSTLHGELQKLTKLGTQPLGEILFANKHILRGAIQIAEITHKRALFDVATEKSLNKDNSIWGRRSVFSIAEKPLLVSEIFLSDLVANL